jgi:hypothetical protein
MFTRPNAIGAVTTRTGTNNLNSPYGTEQIGLLQQNWLNSGRVIGTNARTIEWRPKHVEERNGPETTCSAG